MPRKDRTPRFGIELKGQPEFAGIKAGQIWELDRSANGSLPPAMYRVVSISSTHLVGLSPKVGSGYRVFLASVKTGKCVNRSLGSLLKRLGARLVSEPASQ